MNPLLTGFNANPVCLGLGPTNVPTETYGVANVVVYSIAAAIMVSTAVFYFYMRQYRRRLKIRSMNPVLTGSMGSAIVILIRAVYNFYGREFLPCGSTVALMYLFFILNVVPDNLQVSSFLVKQKFRHQMMAAGIQIAPRHHADTGQETSARDMSPSIATGEESTMPHHSGWATPTQWFKGFWNHFLLISETGKFSKQRDVKYHRGFRFKEDLFVSPLRELSYDFGSGLLMSGPLFFGMGLRIGLVPSLMPQNGCTGCQLVWEEVVILFACLLWLVIIQSFILGRTSGIPDPLRYRMDLIFQMKLCFIPWIGYILAVVDPNNLMKEQKVDWFLFESFAALALHLHRCVLQIYRVSRLHKLGEQQIRLIDLLQDSRAEILFEKYLMGELASENLLFWREGVKYKANFDRNRDFDYSQQFAKMLFRTFVSKHAQLPINISGELREKIEMRFRSGFVGKNVFDEALVEVYNMMQNGPFYRFVRSKEFTEFAKTKADFSGLPGAVPIPGAGAGPNSMTIIPLSDAESGMNDAEGGTFNLAGASRAKFNVAEYVHGL